jgi:hypothetical protein
VFYWFCHPSQPVKPAKLVSQALQAEAAKRTHFLHFGIPFGVTFAILRPLLEYLGYMFQEKKTTWGARGATRDAEVEFRKIELRFGTFMDAFV